MKCSGIQDGLYSHALSRIPLSLYPGYFAVGLRYAQTGPVDGKYGVVAQLTQPTRLREPNKIMTPSPSQGEGWDGGGALDDRTCHP